MFVPLYFTQRDPVNMQELHYDRNLNKDHYCLHLFWHNINILWTQNNDAINMSDLYIPYVHLPKIFYMLFLEVDAK